MPEESEKPTAEQKRAAAKRRARRSGTRRTKGKPDETTYGQPVGAALFRSGPATPREVGRARTHTLGPIRITEDLAERLADYGNELGMNQSDTVRKLLTDALDHHDLRRRRQHRRRKR